MAKFKMYMECPRCKKKFKAIPVKGIYHPGVSACPTCGMIRHEFLIVSAKKLTHWYAPWTWGKREKWEVAERYVQKIGG